MQLWCYRKSKAESQSSASNLCCSSSSQPEAAHVLLMSLLRKLPCLSLLHLRHQRPASGPHNCLHGLLRSPFTVLSASFLVYTPSSFQSGHPEAKIQSSPFPAENSYVAFCCIRRLPLISLAGCRCVLSPHPAAAPAACTRPQLQPVKPLLVPALFCASVPWHMPFLLLEKSFLPCPASLS